MHNLRATSHCYGILNLVLFMHLFLLSLTDLNGDERTQYRYADMRIYFLKHSQKSCKVFPLGNEWMSTESYEKRSFPTLSSAIKNWKGTARYSRNRNT